MAELNGIFSFFNIFLIPLFIYIVKLEHRITKIETLLNCEKEKEK
jgi:hypothetical protein